MNDLTAAQLGVARAWVTPSVFPAVEGLLPCPVISQDETLPAILDTLIVVGGGKLIDRAKLTAKSRTPHIRLIAVPSIWGSGAEASPIVVMDREGRKEITLGAEYIPDERVIYPELARSLSPAAARHACGDCWAHALEGFLSPLADDDLRAELAGLIRDMLRLPIGNDPRWFEASARACAGQAQSSVGLVHGIAHTLEGPLRAVQPGAGWGHACLCATFLFPVMELNRRSSGQWAELLGRHALDEKAILGVVRELFDREAYLQALPALAEHWRTVLRDPCTRTNSVLVRPQHLDHFRAKEFA
jgi:alcohol dehydrogenase class IV